MHTICEPSILYFGTPVVLVGTTNEDGTYNLAPISSVFWLGWRCMIGMGASSKSVQNLIRTKECVLNLPSVNEVNAVNKLAKTTGTNPVSIAKQKRGYRYEPGKFEIAGLTPLPGQTVAAPRVKECPVQLEAVLTSVHTIGVEDAAIRGNILTFELRMQRVHVLPSILMEGHAHRIDPDKWKPLIMSFQEFYGLGEKVHHSTLGEIPEVLYQTPDLLRARINDL